MDTSAKRALYDNLDHDKAVVLRVDTAVRHTRKPDWRGNRFKEREVFNAVHEELGEHEAPPGSSPAVPSVCMRVDEILRACRRRATAPRSGSPFGSSLGALPGHAVEVV